jgi:hypothetical protein
MWSHTASWPRPPPSGLVVIATTQLHIIRYSTYRGDSIALNAIAPPRQSKGTWVVEPKDLRGRPDRGSAVFKDRLHHDPFSGLKAVYSATKGSAHLWIIPVPAKRAERGEVALGERPVNDPRA